MNEHEIATTGAEYQAAVMRLFGFLVDEYGCAPPTCSERHYSHIVAYEWPGRGLSVVFSSAYHPVDYGFEIDLCPAGGDCYADKREMVYFVLKEDQDPEFRFLEPGVAALRKALADAGPR